jgi:LAO/AO transport system kinase
LSSLPPLETFLDGIRRGDRALLARAITLIESRRREHREAAKALLEAILPMADPVHSPARRIGITGVPGVGKSTLIDAFGSMLTAKGHKVAVLAVDPSSTRSGGSILGDKTRMARLAVDANSFIRPSPSGGVMGGVSRMTRETMLLVEAAGYDVVIVETVGVGQSEVMVAEMVDFFLVLALPGAGDELQGIKKGVLELADLIAVNKADRDNRLRAEQAAVHYRRALSILEPVDPDWRPPVMLLSALEGEGLEPLWSTIEQHRTIQEKGGALLAKRSGQQVRWLWQLLQAGLEDRLRHDLAAELPAIEASVAAGETTPGSTAERLLARLFGPSGRPPRRPDGLS